MKIRAFHLTAYLGIFTAWLMVLYVAYYSFYPFKPVDIHNSPYPILNENKQVKAGEEIIFFADFCKNMSVPTNNSTSFVDEIVYVIPGTLGVNSPKGCYEINVSVNVPDNLPPSTYVYRITSDHIIHPLIRNVRVVAETEPFEVVE